MSQIFSFPFPIFELLKTPLQCSKKNILLSVVMTLIQLVSAAQEFKFSTGLGLAVAHDEYSYINAGK
jgi:hypothetical protein